MAEASASAGVLDFTNVKDGGNFNTKRQPEGDYKGKILKVVDSPSKKDNVMQWCFTIQVGSGTYPYYCKHEENQLWKVRNLLTAAGMNVPKKKVKVDPNKLVGKTIGVTLEDDEYEGKKKSVIGATMPANEVDDDDIPDEDEADVDEDEDEDEAPAPAKKKKAAPIEEEEEEEEEEDEDPLAALDRMALKQLIAKEGLSVTVKKSMSDDDIRTGIRAAQATPAGDEDDDDLEEIDIDDV